MPAPEGAKEYDCPQCGMTVIVHESAPERPCSDCREIAQGVPVVSHDEWWERYDKWARDALEETNDGSGSIIDETPIEKLAVFGNGQVRIMGSSIITEKGYVTPWEESEHYCHTRRNR